MVCGMMLFASRGGLNLLCSAFLFLFLFLFHIGAESSLSAAWAGCGEAGANDACDGYACCACCALHMLTAPPSDRSDPPCLSSRCLCCRFRLLRFALRPPCFAISTTRTSPPSRRLEDCIRSEQAHMCTHADEERNRRIEAKIRAARRCAGHDPRPQQRQESRAESG